MPQAKRKGAAWPRAVTACAVILALTLGANVEATAHRHLTASGLDAELAIDATSGRVLFARNDAAPRHPASLTKMMTLYLLFDSLSASRFALQSEIPVSAHAASQPRSHLRLHDGATISVETAMKAIVVCSANDAAVAIAEAIGGSEQHFAELMNAKAHALGMTHTVYRNASGLPDDGQITTAGDLAVLAKHLIYDYPQFFPYFSTRSMAWRGRDFNTHNMLIGNYRGADGIKTGYIDASGYNLVATAMRGKTRIIAVVMGGLTADKRDEAAVDLLDDAFADEDAAARQSVAASSTQPVNLQTPAVSRNACSTRNCQNITVK